MKNMHVDMPTPPELMQSGTPTPGGSTVVTPSIVLPPELRPLVKSSLSSSSVTADFDRGNNTQSDAVDALDLSLPLSTLLRESTKIAHTQAEHSPGAIALAGGTLPVQEYVRYLAMLWVVYSVLEQEIERHVELAGEGGEEAEVLAFLWDETSGGKGRMLRRSEALADDIQFFITRLQQTSANSSSLHTMTSSTTSTPVLPFPVPAFLQLLWQTPPPALTNFVSHLRQNSKERPALLLAHAYVRYLGDLSGGQIVRGKIRRVYGLPSTTSSTATAKGTAFYEFDIAHDDGPTLAAAPTSGSASAVKTSAEGQAESMYERKQKMGEVKEWFRRVLDTGTADGREELKPCLLAMRVARLPQKEHAGGSSACFSSSTLPSSQVLTPPFSLILVGALIFEAIECFHLSTHIFSALDPSPTITGETKSTLVSKRNAQVDVLALDRTISGGSGNQWIGRAALGVLVLAIAWVVLNRSG
ncbi:hypothetical protein QFC22_002908 [Naganishia vaughanmartiniae]|uniref:Uncharacterized protein n=1 Tax=Naganishia vaughanmartiniae TaxID=1424756 RepID=A0ACC2XAB2_9TREE|nr:hypothetical protein QFC22_002908 [Naganishia vaughanmartiniae]